jgi:hypothetical protein
MALPANGDLPQDGSIVSRWVLDEDSGTRVDSVGSNDLTDNNTVLVATTPQFSADAADFEAGNSEYLSVADNASLSITGDLSFSAWVKFESGAGSAYRVIMSKWESGGAGKRAWFLRTSASNQIEFAYSSDGSSTDGYELVAWNPSNGVWYHMAVVYDASAGEVDFYINGAQQGATQTGGPTSIHDGTGALWLGRETTRYMDGLIQDAVLWNAELTAAEVEDLYNAYFNLPDEADLPQSGSLAARWTLTEDGGTRYDQVGTSHLTDNNTVLSGTGIAEVATAERAADFEDGNAENLSVGDNAALSITGDMCISMWINFETVPDGAGTNPPNYVGIANKYSSGQQSFNIAYINYTGAEDRMGFTCTSNGSSNVSVYFTWVPSAATWYHICFVYDASAGECKFYVDGVQTGSTGTGLPTSIHDGTAAFKVVYPEGGEYFDGLIQDFIVWDGVELSDAEVTDLYELYTVLPKTFTPRTIVIS